MSKNSLRIKNYLEHIQEALQRIERYTANLTEANFLMDELVQDAVIRNIEILGEAANNIKKTDAAFTETHSDIPWLTMYAMRNRVSHAYFEVDWEIVWKTIQTDLPKMKQQVSLLVLSSDS
jgi:uncharacterized protein with HEPN domain